MVAAYKDMETEIMDDDDEVSPWKLRYAIERAMKKYEHREQDRKEHAVLAAVSLLLNGSTLPIEECHPYSVNAMVLAGIYGAGRRDGARRSCD
jgi:hypothetical protein